MNRELKLKILKISSITIAIVAVLFIIGMYLLTYQVEGETNLPFKITKIIVVSSSEGKEKQNNENKWALDINQNNDIYLYIEKNEKYGRTEIIENIKVNNFKVEKDFEIGKTNIYKPSEDTAEIFINTSNNIVSEIKFTGELESNIKKNQISNQGGIVVFRCANDRVGEYVSNDGNEINYNTLLKTTGLTNEQLKSQISFDIIIELVDKKSYKATATLDLPVGDIINNQTANLEKTDLTNIVFKRIEN